MKTHYFSVFSLISFGHFRAYLFSQTPQLRVIFVLILSHFKVFKRKCVKVSTNKRILETVGRTLTGLQISGYYFGLTLLKSRFVCLEMTFLVLLFCLKLFSDIADTSKVNSVTKQHWLRIQQLSHVNVKTNFNQSKTFVVILINTFNVSSLVIVKDNDIEA